MSLSTRPEARVERALRSLDGLSVGDGFGDRFFALHLRHRRELRLAPGPPWPLTDDSIMACAIVEMLLESGRIEQDRLAERFAVLYRRDPERGYGGTARKILTAIDRGADWRSTALAAFDGIGSCGNGSAMRVAPLGAYFADDPTAVTEQAMLSAEVTHAHPEGLAGAVAVAQAAALRARGEAPDFADFLGRIEALTPAGTTQARLRRARELGPECSLEAAVSVLGNGSEVTCQRTVPFCLWMAARHPNPDDYESALWETVAAGGDLDTNCAIVGGVLAAGGTAPPAEWLAARERLTAFFTAAPTVHGD